MSLTTCLNKAGPALHAADRGAILARAASLRRAGLSADDAARQAVDERIAAVQGEIGEAAPKRNEQESPASEPVKGVLARRAQKVERHP